MTAKIILTIQNGNLKGQRYLFDYRTSCIVGRAEDCNIPLVQGKTYGTVSRYHCLLDINPPQISIRDLGSLHGTYINGKLIGKRDELQTPEDGKKLQLPQYYLHDGDEIRLSDTTFLVTIQPATDVAPTLSNLIDFQQPGVESTTVAIKPNQFNFGEFIRSFLQRADAGEEQLKTLQGYTLLHKLGTGSCGEVHLARHQASDELVALKLMLSQVAINQRMVDFFLTEVTKHQILEHPHLVKLQNCCSVDGVFLLIGEYCPGGTLRDFMEYRGGKLAAAEAIAISLQLLDGLHYAHLTTGSSHQNIKPSNIFISLTKNGHTIAQLGEFGLRKAFDEAGLSGQTITGEHVPQVNFMSRQQILNFKYVQPEVDVWAIAAILYYMLTGFHPRNSGGENLLSTILQSPIVPIRLRNPEIPKSLADLIDLALQDHPVLHFKNALAFKNALLSIK